MTSPFLTNNVRQGHQLRMKRSGISDFRREKVFHGGRKLRTKMGSIECPFPISVTTEG
jgi:hypothetical protein